MAPKTVLRFSLRLCLLILWLWSGPGCSRDELPEAPSKPPRVVQSIERPPATDDRSVKEAPESEKAVPIDEEEISRPVIARSEKIEDSKPKPQEEIRPPEAVGIPKDRGETNRYTVRPGDTLARLAARNDVYGNPLKWAILYRHNYDQLHNLAESDNIPHQELAPGLKLRLVTGLERKKNMDKVKDQFWVVNILSSTLEKEIIQKTASLIEKGYPVYVTTVLIRGTEWQRVRIGFFKTKNEADEIGRDIMSKLKLTDSWTTKTGEVEFEEFAGY